MFPDFLPQEVNLLENSDSISGVAQLKYDLHSYYFCLIPKSLEFICEAVTGAKRANP